MRNTLNRATPVILAGLWLLTPACGGSSGGGTAGGSGTTTGGSGGSTTGACGSQALSGVVEFTHEVLPVPGEMVGATFSAQAFSGNLDFGCHATCTFFSVGDAGAILDAGTYIDVGSVMATDVTTGANQALTETSTAFGSIYSSVAFAWDAGDTLQIAGGNGAFPTFSISLPSPTPLTITSPPALVAGQTVVASQSTGLTVTWQPASPPATFMSLGILSPAGEIDCYPADSAGTVTISPSVLSNIPVGSYPAPEGLTIGRWNTTVGAAGGKNIGVLAQEFMGAGVRMEP